MDGLEHTLDALERARSVRFEDVLATWGARVLSLARRLLGADDEALDVRQVAYLRLWGALDGILPGNEGAWLVRVTANLCHDRRRRRRANPVGDEELDERSLARAPSAADASAAHELRHRVAEAIDALPDEEREVCLLRHETELTFREIADLLERPVTTIKSRMARALDHLRQRLEDPSR